MKITITRAITELKTLNNRIKKETREADFFGVQVGNNLVWPTRSMKPADFKEQGKETAQSIESLINRAIAIKFAIDRSNFETKVKLGDKEYTITEVLAMKNLIELKKEYFDRLTRSLYNAKETIESKEKENTQRINQLVDQEIANTGKSMVSKDDKENILRRYTQMVEENCKVSLVDPADFQKKIKEMNEELDIFAKEVDYTLSESNSTTFIEIPD